MQTTESAALTTARKAFTTLTREQKTALSRALDGFLDLLVGESTAHPKAEEIISEDAWDNRANWGDEEWEAWETWGWYRHWSRMVSLGQYYMHSGDLTVLIHSIRLICGYTPIPWMQCR